MRYSKGDGGYHVYTEKGETEQQVLRAIMKASSESALGWLHIQNDTRMIDETADIERRQRKTYVGKVADGHFLLRGSVYGRDRGALEPLLERAMTILKVR